MEVYVNGEVRSVPDGTTVAQLVELLELPGRRLAVEVNQCIVSRDRYPVHRLHGGDRIEIVHAIGGG